jgi:D-alanyl-D-alanine carboxypeptidase/D-alanyl-D-alanine-endopeptidase (penicillin-binding protein 4)
VIDDSYFDHQTIPGGWPWDDLGNYYGAGVWVSTGEKISLTSISTEQILKLFLSFEGIKWLNDLKTGGNSDQSLIFTAPHSDVALINGTLPAGKITTVSGSVPNPPLQLEWK